MTKIRYYFSVHVFTHLFVGWSCIQLLSNCLRTGTYTKKKVCAAVKKKKSLLILRAPFTENLESSTRCVKNGICRFFNFNRTPVKLFKHYVARGRESDCCPPPEKSIPPVGTITHFRVSMILCSRRHHSLPILYEYCKVSRKDLLPCNGTFFMCRCHVCSKTPLLLHAVPQGAHPQKSAKKFQHNDKPHCQAIRRRKRDVVVGRALL